MKKHFAIIIALAWAALSFAKEQDQLGTQDIGRIMQQILSQHLGNKEVTTPFIESSLSNYITQFDPDKIYLLNSEVAPFLQMSNSDLNLIIGEYKQNNFSSFKKLNTVIQSAIDRSRKLRSSIEKEDVDLLFNTKPSALEQLDDKYSPYAKDEEELKKRLRRQIETYIAFQRRHSSDAVISAHKEKVLQGYETAMRDFENQYLYQDNKGNPLPAVEEDNLFTIHMLKALASSLDAHTTFYQTKEAYDVRLRLQKEFKGIGVVLKDNPEGVTVSGFVEGGAAAKSGLIKIGDIILQVDGQSTVGMSFDDVMERLHDSTNPDVALELKRKGENGNDTTFSIKLRREPVVVNRDRVDTSYESVGNGIIGKITLHSFYHGDAVTSDKDVRQAIEQLESKGNLKGLILDLRDNSGGFLSEAVKVAGQFITSGIIVISKYSNGEEKVLRDIDGKAAYNGPLIVLTSKLTASAAEIVAQALQDYGVAIIVGDEHTYGKGTIQTQTVTDNQSTSYFKVTVGKYYTVSGRTPQKTGVKADIIVPSRLNKEAIGEEYLDSVAGDTIPDEYNDPLADVQPEDKPWFLKYYVPTLQHPKTAWKTLLPTLKKNSEYRIAKNKNYQLFLKGGSEERKEDSDEEEELNTLGKKKKDYGEEDLQMNEAVNILKDMIYLNDHQPN